MSSDWYANLVDADAQAHCAQVTAKIRDEILRMGPMSFARFMELALYAPGLGYYCVGTEKIGPRGDFVTAPEISPLFAQCLAGYCQKSLGSRQTKTILEIGAGTGRLAAGILKALAALDCLPDQYYILDLSPELQLRQQRFIEENAPEFCSRVQWLTSLPKAPFEGVILANEVLDAMPVTLFEYQAAELKERVVTCDKDLAFGWSQRPASAELQEAVTALAIDFPENYYSEINLAIAPWLRSLEQVLARGEIILIDYGFMRPEYYHPQRATGTVMCHYQQRAHTDPLILAGIQDITAHVDFTAVGKAAEALGMQVSHYSTQSQFLIDNGVLDLLQRAATTPEQQFILANQVKMLILPSEMGELFKVMILKK